MAQVCVCDVCVWPERVYVCHVHRGAHEDQKRVSNTPELEFQVVVNYSCGC